MRLNKYRVETNFGGRTIDHLRPTRWTLGNIFWRLAQREDPFRATGQRGVAIDSERRKRL